MILISHRGILNGSKSDMENLPNYINNAIVRCITLRLYCLI